ncbi:putative mitochondrial protein [Cucumis melo var. makuwa]|uniref:Putative mitochondrial protein n=1 Tax=Cucumis melo var. makuwa TaxID=1194695 RepID=A0A5D3DZN4_CUCMM|nr:putative mitochondrial protein [Cucumis melo var. makuwa]
MFSSLSSFHASLSSPHPFFTNRSTDLFPTSDSPPNTTPCPLPISKLTQSNPISALLDLPYAPCEEPESNLSDVPLGLLAIAVAKQWPLLQMDVKSVFLNGTLSEEVYMKPPPAPLLLNLGLLSALTILPYLLVRHPILLLLYVDDMIVTGDDFQAISDLQCYLGKHFEMKNLGTLSYFLDLEISSLSNGYYLSKAKYASNLLTRSSITDSLTSSTPLDLNVRLTPFDGVPLDDPTLDQQLVGSLIYLIVTHHDITYVVHIVSQFMAAPRTIHFSAIIRILHNIKSTLGHGLQFSSQSL